MVYRTIIHLNIELQIPVIYRADFGLRGFTPFYSIPFGCGSSGGRVVKLLACGARGPGFDSRPCHLNFQRLVISCFQVEIWLKDR